MDDHFFRAFQEAWARVDSVPAGPPVSVTLDRALRAAALEAEDRRSLLGRLRKKLGPIDRIVKPVGVRALPVLAWLAKRMPRGRSKD